MSGQRWAIAAPHTAATEAGVRAFEQGGNAVDAALAAAAVLTVVFPHMCAIGGDVMALVQDAGGKAYAVNGSGRAPRGIDAAEWSARAPVTGPLTITVPGAVAAWDAMADRWGSRPLSEALAPAVAAATDGVPASPSLARSIEFEADGLARDGGARLVFVPDGRPLRAGDRLVQPALARSLLRIRDAGAAELYAGEVGRELVRGLQALGSPLSTSDLTDHRTDVEEPLSSACAGCEVVTMGPNSQGFVLLQILLLLDRFGLQDPLRADVATLASIFAVTADERDRYLADPDIMDVPVVELLSDSHIADIAKRVASDEAGTPPPASRAKGDTVAVVAVDGSGLAVSLIQSVFYSFGSGILEPTTGILCHNRGACFSLDPSSPNAIAPGKRPLHTLMPLLVRGSSGLFSVNGAMGARAQPQIHAQVLLRLLAGASAEDAVDAPRFVVGSMELGPSRADALVEARAPDVVDRLERHGLTVGRGAPLDEDTGHVQVIRVRDDGSFEPASDPRADGVAAAG